MMFASAGLGIYPSWQYSADPAINPKINPNVQYPDGIYQTTVQPIGPWYGGDMSGLGGINWQGRTRTPQLFGGLGVKSGHGIQLLGLRGFGSISDTVSSLGTFIILGLAAFGGWNVYKHVTK